MLGATVTSERTVTEDFSPDEQTETGVSSTTCTEPLECMGIGVSSTTCTEPLEWMGIGVSSITFTDSPEHRWSPHLNSTTRGEIDPEQFPPSTR